MFIFLFILQQYKWTFAFQVHFSSILEVHKHVTFISLLDEQIAKKVTPIVHKDNFQLMHIKDSWATFRRFKNDYMIKQI